jgi:hypothetical protein
LNSSECFGGEVLTKSLELALDLSDKGDIANQGRTKHYPSDAFYHTSCGKGIDPNEIVKKSLYFYMIRHWRAVFGPSRMHMVDSLELLSPQTSRIQFEQILSFLNLCPHSFDELFLAKPANVDKRVGVKMPKTLEVDVNTRVILGSFFKPFDEALFDMMGFKFNWEDQRSSALKQARAAAAAVA